MAFHSDDMTDPTSEDAELTGNGWLAGPYASFEAGKNVFWNTSLLYDASSNDISPDFSNGTFATTRWMADTSLEVRQRCAAVTQAAGVDRSSSRGNVMTIGRDRVYS